MEGVSLWQPLMQQWVKRLRAAAAAAIIEELRKAGEMSSPAVVMNETEVLFDV